MKKITALAALTVAGFSLATPAHADEDGSHPNHGRINVAGRPLNADNICKQALGLVGIAAPWIGDPGQDACADREHTGRVRDGNVESGSPSGLE
ncbi:hypothetical protein [Streptomyces sp. NPDC001851]|uniref:hypothetical protein n=1 Tax=Streptomyces sp. NPDC001851 TaxID=3154529 RepID=UPI0033236A59